MYFFFSPCQLCTDYQGLNIGFLCLYTLCGVRVAQLGLLSEQLLHFSLSIYMDTPTCYQCEIPHQSIITSNHLVENTVLLISFSFARQSCYFYCSWPFSDSHFFRMFLYVKYTLLTACFTLFSSHLADPFNCESSSHTVFGYISITRS